MQFYELLAFKHNIYQQMLVWTGGLCHYPVPANRRGEDQADELQGRVRGESALPLKPLQPGNDSW